MTVYMIDPGLISRAATSFQPVTAYNQGLAAVQQQRFNDQQAQQSQINLQTLAAKNQLQDQLLKAQASSLTQQIPIKKLLAEAAYMKATSGTQTPFDKAYNAFHDSVSNDYAAGGNVSARTMALGNYARKLYATPAGTTVTTTKDGGTTVQMGGTDNAMPYIQTQQAGASQRVPTQGVPPQQAAPAQAAVFQGMPSQGIPQQVVPTQGSFQQRALQQVASSQGAQPQRVPQQVVPQQGLPQQVPAPQGLPPQAVLPQAQRPSIDEMEKNILFPSGTTIAAQADQKQLVTDLKDISGNSSESQSVTIPAYTKLLEVSKTLGDMTNPITGRFLNLTPQGQKFNQLISEVRAQYFKQFKNVRTQREFDQLLSAIASGKMYPSVLRSVLQDRIDQANADVTKSAFYGNFIKNGGTSSSEAMSKWTSAGNPTTALKMDDKYTNFQVPGTNHTYKEFLISANKQKISVNRLISEVKSRGG